MADQKKLSLWRDHDRLRAMQRERERQNTSGRKWSVKRKIAIVVVLLLLVATLATFGWFLSLPFTK